MWRGRPARELPKAQTKYLGSQAAEFVILSSQSKDPYLLLTSASSAIQGTSAIPESLSLESRL